MEPPKHVFVAHRQTHNTVHSEWQFQKAIILTFTNNTVRLPSAFYNHETLTFHHRQRWDRYALAFPLPGSDPTQRGDPSAQTRSNKEMIPDLLRGEQGPHWHAQTIPCLSLPSLFQSRASWNIRSSLFPHATHGCWDALRTWYLQYKEYTEHRTFRNCLTGSIMIPSIRAFVFQQVPYFTRA